MCKTGLKTLTLCGSMRFEKEMKNIAFSLETKHNFNILQCTYSGDNDSLSDDEIHNITIAHYRKIDISDGIYVVDIDGYVGKSVNDEITYAKNKNKEIYYHSEFNK